MIHFPVTLTVAFSLCTFLSCKGQNNQAEEPQAPAQANASFENSVSAEDSETTKSNAPTGNMTTTATTGADFIVFDGIRSRNKPAEVVETGLVPIEIVYAGQIFQTHGRNLMAEKPMDLPSREVVSRIARRVSREGNRLAIINIEHWPLARDRGEQGLANYLTVLRWFREFAPDVQWGYFGLVPRRNDGNVLRPRSSNRRQGWMNANDRLSALPRSVDALYPSLYARDNDRQKWTELAKRYVAEARRLNPNVPVYVFLWPKYLNDSRGWVDRSFWRFQLETAHALADGAVIWMGAGYKWDSEAPWWQETKEFMQEQVN